MIEFKSIVRGLSLLLGLSLWGCAPSAATVGSCGGGCSEDQDCVDGQCLCESDEQCGEGSFCNAVQNCQKEPACRSNRDCADGFLCDTSASPQARCISDDTCALDIHCALGSICTSVNQSGVRQCTPGCRVQGDCELGDLCSGGFCGDALGTEVDGSLQCEACPTSPSPDSRYCDYGEVCGDDGRCVPTTVDLCASCTPTDDGFLGPQTVICPDGQSCLIDLESCSCRNGQCVGNEAVSCGSDADCQSNGVCQTQSYCTPGCLELSDCPSGFGSCARPILTLGSCTSDASCVGTTGIGGGEAICIRSAEQNLGFCAGLSPDICASLQPSMVCGDSGHCETAGFFADETNQPCFSDDDCLLDAVPQEFAGSTAYVCQMRVGVCGKAQGLHCDELTSDAPCLTGVSSPLEPQE